jgi:hypothetical protein
MVRGLPKVQEEMKTCAAILARKQHHESFENNMDCNRVGRQQFLWSNADKINWWIQVLSSFTFLDDLTQKIGFVFQGKS